MDISTGQIIKEITNSSDPLQSITFTPDGRFALSYTAKMSIIIWNYLTGKFLWEIKNQEGYIYRYLETNNGNYKAIGASDNDLLLWKFIMNPNDSELKCF